MQYPYHELVEFVDPKNENLRIRRPYFRARNNHVFINPAGCAAYDSHADDLLWEIANKCSQHIHVVITNFRRETMTALANIIRIMAWKVENLNNRVIVHIRHDTYKPLLQAMLLDEGIQPDRYKISVNRKPIVFCQNDQCTLIIESNHMNAAAFVQIFVEGKDGHGNS